MTDPKQQKPENEAVEIEEGKLDGVSGGYITMEHPDVKKSDYITMEHPDVKKSDYITMEHPDVKKGDGSAARK